MDEHSLRLLEFDRVTASVAEGARCPASARALREARPIDEPLARTRECARLAEAVALSRSGAAWVSVGEGDLGDRLSRALDPTDGSGALDGAGMVEIGGWLAAGSEVRASWADAERRERHPHLAALVDQLPDLDRLRAKIAATLEPDGRVRDDASPMLARARRGVLDGERRLQRDLEKWARGFGETAYVTRHGDRFVALVPAAGFSRKSALVHDVSGTGQSLFVEPFDACEGNNALMELRATAAAEERRILRELAEEVRAQSEPIRVLDATLVALDGFAARARWAIEYNGVALTPGGEQIVLRQAKHPLLVERSRGRGATARVGGQGRPGSREEDGASAPRPPLNEAMTASSDSADRDVVPLDLVLDRSQRLLLVSGPNMGGKTVVLKTVGLAAALAHAAFPVLAAEGSAVPELDQVLADLGDEQSLDRGLSTFAAHLERVGAMASAAGPRVLVLCDELGAGTDPEEGAPLARALLERFSQRGAWGVITTHLGSLKRAAAEIDGVAHGSLEFDEATFTPRYRFLPGTPGASRALAIAERLGLDASVVGRARSLTSDEHRATERLLMELLESRRALDAQAERHAALAAEAEARARSLEVAERHARDTLEQTRGRLTREADALLARVRELWQMVQREARRADRSKEQATALGGRIGELERAGETLADEAAAAVRAAGGEASSRRDPRERAAFLAALKPGAHVHLDDLRVDAELIEGPDAEGKVRLQRGGWNIQSHVEKLSPAAETGHGSNGGPKPPAAAWQAPEEGLGLEVDLRGMDVDEALRAVDTGLDRGLLSGLSELRIIHGVGKGVLRTAVERHLREHPQVATQRMGGVGEGGRGVTIARLR